MREAAAVAYSLVTFAVVVAPALVIVRADTYGGIAPRVSSFDLAGVSAVIGIGYAVVAYRRLMRQADEARSRVNVWISSANALIVLALLATLLLVGLLHGLGPLQSPLANWEGALLATWAVVQLAAVLLAEATERAVFRWLREEEPA